jgi:hypothetical protein
MTEQEEADRLIDQITKALRRDPRYPHLSCLENELLFHDLQHELDEAFERIFEAGYEEGKYWAESEEKENADH